MTTETTTTNTVTTDVTTSLSDKEINICDSIKNNFITENSIISKKELFDSLTNDFLDTDKEITVSELWGDEVNKVLTTANKVRSKILDDYAIMSVAASKKYFDKNPDETKFYSKEIKIDDTENLSMVFRKKSGRDIPIFEGGFKTKYTKDRKEALYNYLDELYSKDSEASE